MVYVPIEEASQLELNPYEMVILSSRHARHLNAKRLATLAQLQEGDSEVLIEPRKMTAVALRELLEGKVQFERSDMQ